MIPGASPNHALWAEGQGAGPAPSGTDCPLGGMVPLARGSWAEGLVLRVNLLTWWSRRAAGERGFMGSSEKLPEPGRGVAITLGRKGQLAPERRQGYLPTAAPNSRGLALVGNDIQAPPALPWQGQSQGQAGRSDLAWGWPSLTRGELFWRGCCRLGWTQGL